MKIRAIKISNFLGVDEFKWNPGDKVNILEGPKGSGKSSVIEAIEKAFSNQGRRTELIRHGQDEATLYVETDTGLEIDRRVRSGKADYLKLRKQGEGIKSTEAELRQFLSGDIFRPLDFINLDAKEQTKIILGMIEMDYTPEQIQGWFGEDVLGGVNTDKHVLQVLKDIEMSHYKEREEVNREIKSLEAQVKGIARELPPNYDGEKWKGIKIQDYYAKVTEAQKLNGIIEHAKALKEGFEDRVAAIGAEAKASVAGVSEKYRKARETISFAISEAKERIGENEEAIGQVDAALAEAIQRLKDKAEAEKEEIRATIQAEREEIAAQKAAFPGLDDQEAMELDGISNSVVQKIETEKERLGKAAEYLENHEPVDVEPLQQEADQVAEMQSFLREWDRMVEIRDGELSKREEYSASLTAIIETARKKPGELLKQHELPIEGISVDEEARIRINDTLLDGLSDGEKLEVAFKIALQRMGDLRVICLDGLERLNEAEQAKILVLCREHDIQAFVTVTKDTPDGKFEIRENGGDN